VPPVTELRLAFEDITESDWQHQLERVPRSNLFQSWAFGEAMQTVEGQTPRRAYLYARDLHVGLVQAFTVRKFGVLSFTRILRGPLFFQPAPPDIHAIALKEIKRTFPLLRLNWSTVMPEVAPSPAWQTAAESRGLNRIMDGYETAWLDLRKPERVLRSGLKQKWRNQLSKAETAALSVEEPASVDWLLDHYDRQRRDRRYTGPSGKLLAALPRDALLALSARAQGELVAGVLFVRHGLDATYQVGWTGEAGRDLNAHNLLLWQALLRLKAAGVRFLDMGGIDAAVQPGIAHFKQGLGGETFHCAGVYL